MFIVLACLIRVFSVSYLALVKPSGLVSSFDTSGVAALGFSNNTSTAILEPFLRWDGLYFAKTAVQGYDHEQDLAFFPLGPLLIRFSGRMVSILRGLWTPAEHTTDTSITLSDVVLGGTVLTNVVSILAVLCFYKLTRNVTGDASFARASAILYAVHPAPAISSVAYTEPVFALCSFMGGWLLFYSKGEDRIHTAKQTSWSVIKIHARRLVGVGALSLATGTRSLGVLNVIFVIWPLVLHLHQSRLGNLKKTLLLGIRAAFECVLVTLPFILFQYSAYQAFCTTNHSSRPWCHNAIPLAYTFIQDTYWNVGFLRYWNVSQLPNFALAMPILLVSIYGTYRFCISHYRRMAAAAQATLPKPPRSPLVEKCNRAIWNNANVIPYMLIHVTTTYLLIFASHTQIALRMAMTNPIVFWTVAGLMGGKHQIWIGRWITWSLSWGAISLVLWASFLPPA